MDKWSYIILNIIFFVPVIAFLFFTNKEIIIKKLRFILLSGLFGTILFFVIDPPAINWKAWQYDYTKTLGINFGKSVFEELVWVILICMIVAIIIEIFFERQKKTSEALKWIVNILNKHNILFQITGGFAAKIYGSKRELADIDIDIQDEKMKEILPELKDHIIFGPKIYKDKNWDLLLLTLKYKGQEIDICGAGSTKIFNQMTKEWENMNANLTKSETKEIYGINIPVIPIADLIKYKNKLQREVDKIDVDNIFRLNRY